MRTKLHHLFIALALLAGVCQAAGQFFRIVGPAASTIIALKPDGTLVWSNALSGTNYTIQAASSLSGGGNWVDYIQLPVANNVNTNQIIDFNPPAGTALIPAGSFTIGDTLDGESDAIPTHVFVSAFYMDTDLVSYSLWTNVYSYARSHGYAFSDAGAGKAANHPVQTVNWFDVVKWSNARSVQAGLTPVYYTDAGLTQVYTNGNTNVVYADWAADGYRLPTEAEWEKAARGGLSGQRFPWGDTISESQANYDADPSVYSYDLGPYNNYNTNFDSMPYPYTSPVGSFAPNGYGLYNMAGNVIEWCWDWYYDNLSTSGSPYAGGTDPRGPATSPYNDRVVRGGDWVGYASHARCANRDYNTPEVPSDALGFRCVRGL